MASRPAERERYDSLTPHLFQPRAQRPLRAKRRRLPSDSVVVPHRHPWAQLAFSTGGVVRMTAAHGTYLVPPSRALWIPSGVQHAVTVLEEAELMTLYLHQRPGQDGPMVPPAEQAPWRECRVLQVTELMHALVMQLDTRSDEEGRPSADELARERLLAALILDELRRARALRLGVALPRDKRLRALCEAVLDDPSRHRTLEAWARDTGASSRTVARLFREQLGTSFGQWRQQVYLTRALDLAAQGLAVTQIADQLGYNSASAFTAMVRRTVGEPPTKFFST